MISIVVSILWFFADYGNAITVEPATLSHGPYHCYLRCVAKCVQSETEKTDAGCWQKCKNLAAESSAPSELETPVLLYANFSIEPEPNPRLAVLEWTPIKGASLYVVQYVESDDKFQTWEKGGLDTIETNLLKVKVMKRSLCPQYEFRVAAINANTISSFSDISVLKEPIPYVLIPDANVIDIELVQETFTDVTGVNISNATVRATVLYTPPPNWSLKYKEFWPLFGYPHVVMCAEDGQLPSFANRGAQTKANESQPLAYFDFPSVLLDRKCLVVAPLDYLKSKCGTSFTYYRETQQPGPMFNLTCENVRNSKCYKPPIIQQPMCNLGSFSFTKTRVNDTNFMSSTLSWTPMSTTSTSNLPIQYWIVKIILSVKDGVSGQYYPMLEFKTIKDLGTRKICTVDDYENECNGTIRTVINDAFEAGSYYVVQICSIYTPSTEKNINWGMAGRFPLDFSDDPVRQIVYRHSAASDQSWVTAVAASLSVLVFCIFLLICVICCVHRGRKRRHRPKNINEFSKDDKSDGRSNNYVDMPKHFDQWELSRKRLVIYDEQKLGSGAFGSVYKGKIGGKLLTHKDFMSVLAENWMKAEDCEVAVKMLPEYADDASKSDFRKEINLMKQLGYHERLVNMLACITADDPLCLVVEYCSEGDLLHYLRDRRKYMIKLGENGIDLQNLNEDHDVDLTMVLCVKDLISFTWQISVGLEYLSQKGFIHRDVAARNILVDKGKKAKIGDFGLCRFSCSDPIYMGKGGRLPIKWMALEAIKNYEFTVKSDVWSFGVLLFEIVTLGGSPYPGIQPSDMEQLLESGSRMDKPDNCELEWYEMMLTTWQAEPEKRPTFTKLREDLRVMLEGLTMDYSYLSLNQKRDYYNVAYVDEQLEHKTLEQHKANTMKQFNYAEDHELEFNSDNAISDNVFLSNDESAEKPTVPVDRSSSFQQHSSPGSLPVVNLLHSAVHTDSISLTDHSAEPLTPRMITNGNWRESATSDQALITPQDEKGGKMKMFKLPFKPMNIPEELNVGYENSAYSTMDNSNEKI